MTTISPALAFFAFVEHIRFVRALCELTLQSAFIQGFVFQDVKNFAYRLSASFSICDARRFQSGILGRERL